MTDKPNSPTAPTAPKSKAIADPPAGIRQWGILSAADNCPQGQRVKAVGVIWSYFGGELVRAFYR